MNRNKEQQMTPEATDKKYLSVRLEDKREAHYEDTI